MTSDSSSQGGCTLEPPWHLTDPAVLVAGGPRPEGSRIYRFAAIPDHTPLGTRIIESRAGASSSMRTGRITMVNPLHCSRFCRS